MRDFEKETKERPHVVLLGAGASIATIPYGDKNGKKISAMNGFIKNLNLSEIIKNVKLKTKSKNLEDIYSEMHSRPEYEEECKLLEQKIYEYFSKYELPDVPTVYDHLILGLTKKDLIATFNWDPLLMQAYHRAMFITKDLPELAFLHGNVAVKTCEKCKIITDSIFCPECGNISTNVKLLFPIKNKNYADNPFVRNAWAILMSYLKNAYMVTIFGYSAPKTDQEAVSLLKNVWGQVDKRNLEQFTFIDIREEEDVVNSWEEFVHTHHYDYCKSFYDSRIAKFPRRTCETTFDQFMNNIWLKDENPFTATQTMEDLVINVNKLINKRD